MAVASQVQSVLCLVTLMGFLYQTSVVVASEDTQFRSKTSLKRLRRQAEVSYDLTLTQPQVFPEDTADDTILYDFKTINIGQSQDPTSSFRLKVITTADSQPSNADAFEIDDNQQLVFSSSVSREDRRNDYFDFEQFPEIIVIVEAVHINSGQDKRLIKLTIQLSDVNDELPVLKNQPFPYLASIPVNPNQEDTVYILLAEDPDTSADLSYSIDFEQLPSDSSIRSIFRMDEVVDTSGSTRVVQGHIKIAIGASLNLRDSFIIPVNIQDRNGILPQVITAEVDVLVGPRRPQFFQRAYEGSIFESKTANNPVFTGSGSSEELIIKVHQFQENFPISLRLLKDNNEESTRFRIDEDGKVYNTESLEFDIQESSRPPRYQLIVKVVEMGDSQNLESTVPLVITIKDENDNPPRFQLTQYLETIPEDSRPGFSVLSVLAEDLDSGKNAEVTYEITNDYFRIEKRVDQNDGKTYGDIFVKSALDYDAEPGPTYRFTVMAKDGGSPVLSSSVDVYITTSNVNDENPVIEPQESLILRDDVLKVDTTNTYILTRIRANDRDGDGIKFFFTNPDPSDGRLLTRTKIFEIKPATGVIQVTAEVPADINSYYINVTAVDDGMCCGGKRQLMDETSFVVEIVDAVNQKPTFDDCLAYNLRASFKEESAAGSPVILVSATDTGRGVNGIVEYFIESPNPNLPDAFFEINRETGQITIKNPLDREPNVNFKQITVKAADKAVPPQEGWCTFRVNVEDINDNGPIFARDYVQELPSNAQLGRIVLRVGATDRDIGDNAKISYTLDEDGGGVFSISEDTGLISLARTFTPGVTEYNLVVKAEDHGDEPQSSTVNVKVLLVGRENFEPPEFIPKQSSYTYRVAENVVPKSRQAIISTLQCRSNTPSDQINPGVQFFLVSEDGNLHPRELDMFSIESFETASGYFVNVSVSDDLDYETQTRHNIILRCQNFAALTLYEEILLEVNVIDKNDLEPYFAGLVSSTGRYIGTVPENMNDPFIIIDNIQGYDDDASSEFNQLNFRLAPGKNDDDFEILPLEGNKAAIRTKTAFDREEQDRYYLTVIIDDISPSDLPNAAPGAPNTATAVVEVVISDENDNQMEFKQSVYSHSVKETANLGEIIFPVTADDIDEVDQGRLRYSFISPPNIPFDIRDQTGEIFVTGKLDFDNGVKEYRLTLESRDSLNRYSDTTTVVISVTDENDNIPVFNKQVYENSDVFEEDTTINIDNPRFLVQVEATDLDVSRNETKIRYRLLGKGTEPGDQQIFTIDPVSGRIHLVAILDRDTNPEYIFTVEALDEEVDPQKGYVNVKVFPIDINDNRPQFDRDSLTDSVDEGIPEGSVITQVKATDIDAGKNAEIEYEIDDSSSTDVEKMHFFRVEKNGEIFSQVDGSFLDREKYPEFNVVIRARDKGDEPLSSTATLTIKLRDINDNAPVFTEDVYNVLMSENTKSDIIKEVVATDQDIGKHAALRYFLPRELNPNNNHFAITFTNNKGYLSITNPVDYEVVEQRHFQLTITVDDNDVTHIDTAIVNITVEDFNDNAPVFDIPFQTRHIKEGRLPGENITTFIATDADSGVNALKSYQIDRKNDPRREFYIDPDTGLVQTRKTLDREVSPTLSINILAIDQGDPRQTGTATLSIIVDDVNDNYPIFREDYRPVVDENQDQVNFPLFVVEVLAKDLDTPIYGPPYGFALPDPCEELACEKFFLKFEPDRDNGDGSAIITTNSVFDREEHKEYHLPIIMWDMRGSGSAESQTGTNTLTIVIGDLNDNEPFPGHQDIFVYNYKGLFGSFVIGRVFVEDQDDWDLPDKTFTYQGPGSLARSFLIDEDSGDVTMQDGVASSEDPYEFRVSVYDKVFDKTVVCTVAVFVQELSEEAVMKSGSVRLAGMTGAEFIVEKTNPRTGKKEDSLYTKFRALMAEKLNYPGVDNVEITTLRDDKNYLEVRYAAHGSPYLTPAEVDNVIIMNRDDFENIGIEIMSIPVDECEDEIFEGGCYNKLNITGRPLTINSRGSGYVGVEAFLEATEGCQADVFPASNDCSGDYCFNGGTCHKDDWGTLSCQNCPSGFTGSRCQERRHHFDGNSVAFYKTFLQCEQSQTSIEFVTQELNGVLLYNGPIDDFNPLESPQDFLLLMLEDGYPVLMIDHGTGMLTLRLDSLLHKLNDGEWHHLDINRDGKFVELVVDKCNVAEDPDQTGDATRTCRASAETPGVNMYLNVKTLLQVGGVRVFSDSLSHLAGLSLPGFNGCVRNLVHNKELYNLHFRSVQGLNSGTNGCPFEDAACGVTDNSPKCGLNGDCEATMAGYVTCVCHAGFYGATCNKETTVRDFHREDQSYYYWQIKDEQFNSMLTNRELQAHIRFRTRQTSGNLMYLLDSTATESHDIQLKLHNGRVRLSYELGGGRKNLDLAHAMANNGQWHTLVMQRYGREFHLRLDGGEGRNYAFTLGDRDGSEDKDFRMRRNVYSGGYKETVNGRPMLRDNLKSTCIEDVRINNGYFAMTTEENSDSDAVAEVIENPATEEGCERDDCPLNRCPGRTCVKLWESHECRCNPGFYEVGSQCRSICLPNPCFNNVTCRVVRAEVSCVCPAGWRGQLCDERNPEGVTRSDLSSGAMAAIVAAIILVVLVIIVVVLLYKFCGSKDDGEKYILEVDPEDDIRENVMNYDEEGAGEEDQDAYDISRLQKPNFETGNRPYDPDKRRDVHRRDAPGDKPDVGVFIEDRLNDADDDDGAPPHDSVREFTFEGGDSDAGSLSSLNTSSSDRSQDYDYLNEWGPKFAKLADMYGAGQELES